ncbi:MAG: bifunctional riboflavin kinase/FAD synthetase [Bacteroidetes bacterium]|nr:bifunctional riboflavin kinase/FAD synthetase [Bacteroidota bacterium]
MRIFEGIESLGEIKNPVVTIGTFDGVHLGHQKIIEQLNFEAEKIGGESVLLTFDPHPRIVLFPENHNVKLIQTLDEKFQVLEKFNLKNLVLIPFTKEFSELTATEFVEKILIGNLKAKKFVIGYDHQFGRNREGNIQFLKSVSEKYGFEVIEISAKSIDEINISSTKIRNSLLQGDVETAKLFLSRPYEISGTVIRGNQLGRTLGFPTANVQVDSDLTLIPANGVYAIRVKIDEKMNYGVMNIGTKPTVKKTEEKSLEVFIFDFNSEIYGARITLFFEKQIRNEQKFANLEDLKMAISNDEIVCRQYFNLPLVKP